MYDILSGSVKMNSILGTPLIEVKHDLLPEWERLLKKGLDYILALHNRMQINSDRKDYYEIIDDAKKLITT